MRRERFSDQVRAAVDASGRSRYAICKAIGLNQGAMSRFMAGKGGVSLETLDKLAELLGLSIVAGQAPARGRRRSECG
jgi:transcriptional regulator with XRE-family HTH domain